MFCCSVMDRWPMTDRQTDRQDEHTRYWWYCWSPEWQVRIFSFSDRFSMCELFSYLWLVIWWKQKGKSLFSFISICEKGMFCLFHGISCRFCEWNIVRIKSGRMFAFSCENISFFSNPTDIFLFFLHDFTDGKQVEKLQNNILSKRLFPPDHNS